MMKNTIVGMLLLFRLWWYD